ncbi:neurohypophysial n-terminal domain protein [Ichthyophthirius multifiliis]|uniref:Neurohypophysial n-terminal domain protein n=1 Tax=Ichthyophthirius multifiliis TaxID=5932 RepID=G0R5F6_ICHMU|nr:neurohypophysial n-terminal domain protein [Ichthyophthirius multifiliis]EGR27299.1 neurohypophysial n-terminal domain protein [Ichthyophthirius multifiliis]|eukprot:XP_004024183.1 neurohypophysial n-terminal domain protein [Ichthyophthirius multifiliis]
MFQKTILINLLIFVILTQSSQQQNDDVVNTSTVCQEGYYQDQDTHECVSCEPNFGNCIQCTQSSCSKCATGYLILNSETKCIKDTLIDKYTGDHCNEGCDICYQSGECMECRDGYYLNFDDKGDITCLSCTSKIENCQRCTKNSCTRCQTGFSNDNSENQCQDQSTRDDTNVQYGESCSQEGCDKCSQSGECLQCQDGFYQDLDQNGNKVCISCSSKFSNCQRCTYNFCERCITRYSYNMSEKQCKEGSAIEQNLATFCFDGCYSCSDSGECKECWDGYYDDYEDQENQEDQENHENKNCVSCSSKFINCVTCDKNRCTQCRDGYNYNESQQQCLQNPISRFLHRVQANYQ